MANTYTQIYIHIIFVVKRRQNIIPKKHKEELHKFICGITTKRGQKLLSINCMPDHTHMLVGLKPNICLSDLSRDIKAGSSKFINDKGWLKSRFEWQVGFAAFSYAHSDLTNIITYINNQEKHHKKRTFKDEYIEYLNKYDVAYNENYLFEFFE